MSADSACTVDDPRDDSQAFIAAVSQMEPNDVALMLAVGRALLDGSIGTTELNAVAAAVDVRSAPRSLLNARGGVA